MASSLAVCRLHLRGKASLLKCLQKVDTFLHRSVGTGAVPYQAEETRKYEHDEKNGFTPMHTLLAERQEQAERSVLISYPPKVESKNFLRYLSAHGDVKNYFFYESYGMYAVVEFANREGVASLLQATAIPSVSHEAVVPFKSRLLSLKDPSSARSQKKRSGQKCQPQTTLPINDLIDGLSKKDNIDQQMAFLTEAYQLTEENIRLRFLVCSLLKDIAAAYFPDSTIKPFGSSVNGFGKLGCDLDMLLDLDTISGPNATMPQSGLSMEFQMKSGNSERTITQAILSVIAQCVDQFGPGCVGVQKILNARCPLVRFVHQPSGFQCDLTANNRVAMKSTELLYMYGELDPRVRALVLTIRCIARAHGITSSIPGAWITNFSLTAMVLFYLQKTTPPIIPTLNQLQALAGPADKSVIDGNDCTFVSDLSKIQLERNTDTAEQLLRGFFQFYGSYPFGRTSINIRKGKEQDKPEMVPMHIQNPFEPSHNISKNVNSTHLDHFVSFCQENSWLLEQRETVRLPHNKGLQAWGLAALLLPSQATQLKSRRKKKRELATDRIKSLLESLKSKHVP